MGCRRQGDENISTIKFIENISKTQPPSARDNEKCANQIANNLAKKFGPGWNAVVGEAFSFEISYTKYVKSISTSQPIFIFSCITELLFSTCILGAILE